MFKEDVVRKEVDPGVATVTEFFKSILYSGIIQLLSFSLRIPAVYSVLPLMLLIFVIMIFTRDWNNKKRQYAFLIPYVLEYFGCVLYFYNNGRLMPVTATCMAVILAVWGVVCIECFPKKDFLAENRAELEKRNERRLLIGLLIFFATVAIAETAIWFYYENKANETVREVMTVEVATPALGKHVDEVCDELNAVYYSKTKLHFKTEAALTDTENGNEVSAVLYSQFKGEVKASTKKGIGSLFRAAELLADVYDEMQKEDE